MKIKRRILMLQIFVVVAVISVSCCGVTQKNKRTELPQSPIVVIYDNDVHCAVNGYPKLVVQRESQKQHTPYVTTVSCGDFVSGSIVGAVSKGEYIVQIMNRVGYDVVALGNHEFDYGMSQMFKLTDSLTASVVCANLKDCQTDKYVFPAYRIVSYGNVDIAYIGFTTTMAGTVKMLSDDEGNLKYSFMKADFYRNAQRFIDESRRNGADYVVALTHLGDTEGVGDNPSSTSLIANTVGIDAVIDGHDHHVIAERFVKNKNGDSVLLTSSGTAFCNLGVLMLTTEGRFKSTLINLQTDKAKVDECIHSFVDSITKRAESGGTQIIGYSDVKLSVNDESGERIVRIRESNIGNFFADAFRYCTRADVALINGGGIRTDLKKGDISYNDVCAVMPFGNLLRTATMTGQQLLDALEMSVSYLPYEDGAFLQVSGIKFDVDISEPSPVVMDLTNELFSHVGNGKRRVSNLRILDSSSGCYKPVDLNHNYTIASHDYLLVKLGCNGILRYAKISDDKWCTDVQSAIIYIQEKLGGRIGTEYADVENRINIK